MQQENSFIKKIIEKNQSLIKRIILCGVATISMVNSMGALSHGSLVGVCKDEIKDIDQNLLMIQEDYQTHFMKENESYVSKLSRDYASGIITFDEYRKACDKIQANNFVNALLVPNNVSEDYKSNINYYNKRKEKLEEETTKHKICCGVNTGLFAISGVASLVMLKKRFDEIDEKNNKEIQELQSSSLKK